MLSACVCFSAEFVRHTCVSEREMYGPAVRSALWRSTSDTYMVSENRSACHISRGSYPIDKYLKPGARVEPAYRRPRQPRTGQGSQTAGSTRRSLVCTATRPDTAVRYRHCTIVLHVARSCQVVARPQSGAARGKSATKSSPGPSPSGIATRMLLPSGSITGRSSQAR